MTGELENFLRLYKERLSFEDTTAEERKGMMLAMNPKFILRNYLAQMAIEDYYSNPKMLDDLFNVLTHPYEEWPEFEGWSRPAPVQYKNLSVSCSS